MWTTFFALIQSAGLPVIVKVYVSHVVPSIHISSEVTSPRSGSPRAPPAVAVPCQVTGEEVNPIEPAFGFEACTLGNATNATLNNAKTQTKVINTPKELSARQDINLENSEAGFWLFLFKALRRRVCFAVGFIVEQLLRSGEKKGGTDAPDGRATKLVRKWEAIIHAAQFIYWA
jgi:hypothetical protein